MTRRAPSPPDGPAAPRPPRLARWLVARAAPDRHREFVLGDLAEEHARLLAARGRLHADLVCWRHALRCAIEARTRSHRPRTATAAPRARRGDPMIGTLVSDLRLALRSHRRRPGLALAVIVILALAGGAVTAIFTVVDAALLDPIPFSQPDGLVAVFDTRSEQEGNHPASFPELVDWRASEILSHLAGVMGATRTLTGLGTAETVEASLVSSDLFPMLGIEPVVGRVFTADEEGEQVVLASWSFWQRRLGGDPARVGGTLTLDGKPHTLLGILPRDFTDVYPRVGRGARGRDLWLPLHFSERAAPRGLHFLSVIGRLRPGSTLEQTAAELEVLTASLRAQGVTEHGIGLEPFAEVLTRDRRQSLTIVAAAALCVLLAACANVAGLLLARGAERGGEIAVRRALGARPSRLVVQLLLEGAALSAASLPFALALAAGLVALLEARLPFYALEIGARSLVFALALGTATTLLFATAPALHLARRRASSLASGRDRLARSPRQGAARRWWSPSSPSPWCCWSPPASSRAACTTSSPPSSASTPSGWARST